MTAYQIAADLVKQTADGCEKRFLFAYNHQFVNALSENLKTFILYFSAQRCPSQFLREDVGEVAQYGIHKQVAQKLIFKG